MCNCGLSLLLAFLVNALRKWSLFLQQLQCVWNYNWIDMTSHALQKFTTIQKLLNERSITHTIYLFDSSKGISSLERSPFKKVRLSLYYSKKYKYYSCRIQMTEYLLQCATSSMLWTYSVKWVAHSFIICGKVISMTENNYETALTYN